MRARGGDGAAVVWVDAWEESLYYSPRGAGGAVRWAEELTRISETHASEEAYAELKGHFSEQEIVEVTFVMATD